MCLSANELPAERTQAKHTRCSTAILALFASLGLAPVAVTPLPAQAQQQQPNILFIMGDDIGWMQPSIYHEGLAVGETPNIDRIGHEGAKFMTYYAEQSCTAGRTAFISKARLLRAEARKAGRASSR